MARRNSKHWTGLFREYQYDAMVQSLRKLRNRMLSARPHGITPDDILALSLPEEHHQQARDAVRILRCSAAEQCFLVVDQQFQLRCDWEGGQFILPRMTFTPLGMGTDAYKKVEALTQWHTKVERDFSLVYHLIYYLNHCWMPFADGKLLKGMDAIRAARFYMPAVPALLAMNERHDVKTDAAALEAMPSLKSFPEIVKGFREAAREASAIVTRAAMLPAEMPDTGDVVEISRYWTGQGWVFPGSPLEKYGSFPALQ